ncbi:hypothetical protein [Lysobacter enzymogenes]|nr:hypothetical protein [Lysobacter enzymogenes]
MKAMKALALCLLVLALSACNPAYDNPPLLHAAAKAAAPSLAH